MARVLKFRKYTTDTDLLVAPYRFVSWGMVQAKEGETVVDTFEMLLVGTNAQIVTGGADIDRIGKNAQDWFDDVLLNEQIWIYAYADGESPKRALVETIDVKHADQEIFNSLLGREGIRITMAITHWPWENDSIGNVSKDNLSAWGGTGDVSAGAVGTIDGRPHKVTISGRSGGGGPLDMLWLGIRPFYDSVTGFDPIVELEKGTLGTDAALASETGASPSGSSTDNKVRVTFATTSLAKRLSIRLDQAYVSGHGASIGEFAMLLRCKVSSGSTIGVQARTGMAGSASFAPNEEVYDIANTNYKLIDVGYFSVPPIGFRQDLRDLNYYAVTRSTIELWAEVINSNGGTDWIDLDAICLMPARHLVVVKGAKVQYTTVPDNVKMFVFADERTKAVSYVSGVPDAGVEARFNNWKFPTDPGVMVLAGQRLNSHVLTDTVDVEYLYYPRWRTLRG